jgi:hypothetical protein
MPVSKREREQFLADPHIGALSVVEAPDRGPLTVPIWYGYTPGGEVWIHTGPDSRKARAIEAASRFSIMVQRVEPTVRYVSVEGPVTRREPGSRECSTGMAARYLPAEKVAEFVDYDQPHLGEHVAIYMRPEHWLSADMGPV